MRFTCPVSFGGDPIANSTAVAHIPGGVGGDSEVLLQEDEVVQVHGPVAVGVARQLRVRRGCDPGQFGAEGLLEGDEVVEVDGAAQVEVALADAAAGAAEVLLEDHEIAEVDAQFSTTFLDVEMRERFREYHHEVADLRIVSAQKNLSLGGSERMRKPKNPVELILE